MLIIGKTLGGMCGEANSPLQRTALLHIKPTPSAAVASWLSGSFWPPRLPNEESSLQRTAFLQHSGRHGSPKALGTPLGTPMAAYVVNVQPFAYTYGVRMAAICLLHAS